MELRSRRNAIVISVVLVTLIVFLIAVLFIRGVWLRDDGGDPDVVVDTNITATVTPTSGSVIEDEATPTPTKVLADGTPTSVVDGDGTATPTAKAGSASSTTTPAAGAIPASSRVKRNLVKNDDFESGFTDAGVAEGWKSFNNGGAKYIFAAESWPLAVRNGNRAQRITIYESQYSDRYAGIYQTFSVVPNQTYTLKMYGQIRSKMGDVKISQYGYRMQYAIDWEGGTDWEAIPNDRWIELPWDEQLVDSADVEFLDYTRNLIPGGNKLTLFVRAWNKWADANEAQYTLDGIELIGPASQEATQAGLVDDALPDTGGPATDLSNDPRFWGSLLFLGFLAITAMWRFRKPRPIAR